VASVLGGFPNPAWPESNLVADNPFEPTSRPFVQREEKSERQHPERLPLFNSEEHPYVPPWLRRPQPIFIDQQSTPRRSIDSAVGHHGLRRESDVDFGIAFACTVKHKNQQQNNPAWY
jgi:hypothetical protein